MKIHGYDKEVVEIGYRWANNLTMIIEKKGYCFGQDSIIALEVTPRTFTKSFSPVPDEGILYFDKSCTFPRYKLEGTKYTRCIKMEKATAIVTSKSLDSYVHKTWKIYTVYEHGDKLYITDLNSENHKIQIQNKYPGIKPIYSGKVCEYRKEGHLLLQNITKPVILDEDLDRKVSSNLPTLTEDDCKQIVNMMSSTDDTTVDLGVKLLSSFNVIATPFTVKTILCLNNRWTIRNVATNVATEAMLNSIKLSVNAAKNSIRTLMNDNNVYSDYDKTLATFVLKPSLATFIKERIRSEILVVQQQFGLKVNITVE